MKHFKKHHKGFPPGFEDAKIYICDECPEEFLTPYNLANHKTAVHKFRDEKFVCDHILPVSRYRLVQGRFKGQDCS